MKRFSKNMVNRDLEEKWGPKSIKINKNISINWKSKTFFTCSCSGNK